MQNIPEVEDVLQGSDSLGSARHSNDRPSQAASRNLTSLRASASNFQLVFGSLDTPGSRARSRMSMNVTSSQSEQTCQPEKTQPAVVMASIVVVVSAHVVRAGGWAGRIRRCLSGYRSEGNRGQKHGRS